MNEPATVNESDMSTEIEELMQAGIAAHQSGDLEQASRAYRLVLEREPSNSDAHHNLGVVRSAYGDYETANTMFKSAVKSNPAVPQYWISSVRALITLGKLAEARMLLVEYEGRFGEDTNISVDQLNSLKKQVDPETNLAFFHEYLSKAGIHNSTEEELRDDKNRPIPLLTNTFLCWFETQSWRDKTLLELGAGNSTLYFAEHFSFVRSYETDSYWFAKLLEQIPTNVQLEQADRIREAVSSVDPNTFDAVLVDAGENRANLVRWLIENNYRGLIFLDNAEWYRNSVGLLLGQGAIEIPFFGIKPTQDRISATSLVAWPEALTASLSAEWQKWPELSVKATNSWDIEDQ